MTLRNPTISQRVAEHLKDYPIDEPSDQTHASDQLLNDVLDQLRMFYPGAYSDFVLPVPPIAT